MSICVDFKDQNTAHTESLYSSNSSTVAYSSYTITICEGWKICLANDCKRGSIWWNDLLLGITTEYDIVYIK